MTAPRVTTKLGRKGRRRNGQSLVEFALVLPVFLLILAGILDYGFMLFARMNLINATREGARWAVVQEDSTQIPTAGGFGLTEGSGAIATNLQGLRFSPNTTITITCVPDIAIASNTACDFASGGNRNAVKGDSIRIATRYAYTSFFSRFFGSTVNLGTQVQMVLECAAIGTSPCT